MMKYSLEPRTVHLGNGDNVFTQQKLVDYFYMMLSSYRCGGVGRCSFLLIISMWAFLYRCFVYRCAYMYVCVRAPIHVRTSYTH